MSLKNGNLCSFVSNLSRALNQLLLTLFKLNVQSRTQSEPKTLRLVAFKCVTCNHSHLLWLLELKEGGCVDESAEGDVDHEHCPRPGGDFHLTRSVTTWLTQGTDTFPTHFFQQTQLFVLLKLIEASG